MFLVALNPTTYAHLYNNIFQLRTEFGLPVKAEVLTSAEALTHYKIYRSELKELALATKRVDILDAIVDCCVTLVQPLVHQTYRGWDRANKEAPEILKLIDGYIDLAAELGMDFLGGWDEIHASNMSKICATEEDLQATESYYLELGVPTVTQPAPSGGWVVLVATTVTVNGEEYPAGKFLKNRAMKKPQLAPFV